MDGQNGQLPRDPTSIFPKNIGAYAKFMLLINIYYIVLNYKYLLLLNLFDRSFAKRPLKFSGDILLVHHEVISFLLFGEIKRRYLWLKKKIHKKKCLKNNIEIEKQGAFKLEIPGSIPLDILVVLFNLPQFLLFSSSFLPVQLN